jgi:phosphoribosylaminoimidazole-succinocarboxamide synthase
VSVHRMYEIVGEEHGSALQEAAVSLYSAARDHAAKRGIIIADTKFEFGLIDGVVTLVDEVLTPDSSRFWPAATYAPGAGQPSFDKQYVRDWLTASGWDKTPPPPALPADVIARTSETYIKAYELITGRAFQPERG